MACINEHIQKEPRPSINSKTEMRELLKSGALGNHFQQWENPKEAISSGYRGNYWLSQSIKSAGPVDMNIPQNELVERYEKFLKKTNIPSGFVQVNEAAPNEWVEFNAEVQVRPDGLYVRYSREKTNMRDAFTGKATKHIKSLEAKMFLQQNLDPEDYEDLQTLLNLYSEGKVKYGPSHIIEIHKFNRPVGNLQRKMVIGEVRNY